MAKIDLKTVPCETCGDLTTFTGTKRCNNCYEVEGRLSTYLRSPGGRRFVANAVAEQAAPVSGDPPCNCGRGNYHAPVGRPELARCWNCGAPPPGDSTIVLIYHDLSNRADRPSWAVRGNKTKIKPGVEGGGRLLTCLGPPILSGQLWLPVLDPLDDDPTFYKLACLEPASG